MKERKEIVIINESVIGSIIKDIGTFTLFAGLLYFNHGYLAGASFVDIFFLLLVLLFLTSRNPKSVNRFIGYEDAIKYLEGKK